MAMSTSVGEIVLRMRADTGNFQSAIQAAQNSLKGMGAELGKVTQTTSSMSTSLSNSASALTGMARATQQSTATLSQLAAQATAAAAGTGALTNAARTQVGIGGMLSSVWNGLVTVGKVATGMFIAWRGAVYATNVVFGPLINNLKSVADEAMKFELAWAAVLRTVQGSESGLGALRDDILDLSTRIPVAATELARIASVGGQMGIQAPDIERFTEVVARMSETFEMAGDQAAIMLARIAFVNKVPTSDFDKLASSIVATADAYNASANEMMRTIMLMQAMGSQAGLTIQQMIAFGAIGMSSGQRVESFGTAIGRIAMEISKAVASNGPKLQAFASVARMSGEQFAAAWSRDKMEPIMRVYAGISAAGERQSVVLEKLGMVNIRVMGAVLSGAVNLKELEKAYRLATQSMEEGTALQQKSELVFGTTAKQVQLLENQFTRAKIELGTAFLPVMKEVLQTTIDAMQRLTQFLRDNASGIENFANSLRWLAGIPTALAGFVDWVKTVDQAIGNLLFTLSKLPGLTGPLAVFFNVLELQGKSGGKPSIFGMLEDIGKEGKRQADQRRYVEDVLLNKPRKAAMRQEALAYAERYGTNNLNQYMTPDMMREFQFDPEFQQMIAELRSKEQMKEEKRRQDARNKEEADRKRAERRMRAEEKAAGMGPRTEAEALEAAQYLLLGVPGYGATPELRRSMPAPYLQGPNVHGTGSTAYATKFGAQTEAELAKADDLRKLMLDDAVREQMLARKREVDDVNKKYQAWKDTLSQVHQAFQLLGVSSDSFVGRLVGGIVSAGTAIADLRKGMVQVFEGGTWSKGFSNLFKTDGKFDFGKLVNNISSGFQIASAAISIGKGLVGLFKKDPVKKAQKEIGKALGQDISREMAQQMMDEAKAQGVSLQEIIKRHKDKIAADQKRERDRVVSEGLTMAQEGLGSMMGAFYTTKEEREKAQKDGGPSSVLNMFSNPTLAKTSAGAFSAVFWATVKEKGLTEATKAMKDIWERMLEGMKEAGVDIDALGLGSVSQLFGLAENESFAGASNAASGMGQVITGMAQAGYVDQALMSGATSMAGELQDQAERAALEAGMAPAEATKAGFQAVQPLLQAQLDAALASGAGISEELQALLDEARANGIDIIASPMVQQLEELRRIRAAVEGKPYTPAGSGTANTRTEPPEQTQYGAPPDMTSAKGFGPRLLKEDTVFQAHQGEHVAIYPKGHKVAFRSAARGFLDDVDDDGVPIPRERETESTTVTPVAEAVAAALTESLNQAVERIGRPVQISPQISINEDPEGDKETRVERRRSTVDAVTNAFRQREPALMIEARRALGL